MQRQKEMEASFQRAHSQFIHQLSDAVDILERDISEAEEMEEICTDEWCQATETVLDDLAKLVFSIHEPRWQSKEDSDKIKHLRGRIHDLYARYKSTRTANAA